MLSICEFPAGALSDAWPPFGAGIAGMKFAKLCEEACVELESQTKVPAFPYKALKKQLKKAEDADNGRQHFTRALSTTVKSVDDAWQRAVRSVLKGVNAPRMSAVLSHIGVIKRRPKAAAPALAEWASIARTGLRKIKKKYNKRLGAKFGPLDQEPDVNGFAFVASSERTEIQALASSVVVALEEESGSSPEAKTLECPVCMETLYEPVAPPCGHPMCRSCYDGIAESKVTRRFQVPGGTLTIRPAGAAPQCPICREPATSVKPMSALASMCKAADPEAFAERQLSARSARKQRPQASPARPRVW